MIKRKIWKRGGSWSFSFLLFLLFLLSPFFCRAATSDLLITEIMYSPAGTDDKHEWVEIKNSGTSDVTIITGAGGVDSWRFFDGDSTNHKFTLYPIDPGLKILNPGDYAILAQNPDTFKADHPNFSGTIFQVAITLKNSGRIMKLSADKGSTWFSETQYISFFGANGNGKSLEYTNQGWRESFVDGGTPGKENSVADDAPKPKEYTKSVYISEIFPHPPTGKTDEEYIKLYNPTENDIDLAGWQLDDEPNGGSLEYTILSDRSGGSMIKASSFLVFERSETGLALNDSGGDMARLLDPNGREISQTPNYGTAKAEKKFYRDEKGVWRWEEEIVGEVIELTTIVVATTAAPKITTSVATSTEITTTTTLPPAIEGKIKGIETIKKENPLLRKIALYILDASIFLLLLLLGDYLWKLQLKAQKKLKD